ncbi:MAG: ion transporter [Methanomicrobiales archaeon]|nr:ion transporter [Methanomicrobiales archaeon]
MTGSFKQRAYHLLEEPANRSIGRKIVVGSLFVLISLNVLVAFLETVHGFYANYEFILHPFTVISVGIFTIEYLLRLWVCSLNPLYHAPVTGRIRYILTPLAIFDLMTILPFFLPILLPFDLRVLRFFRLTRVFTVLKMGRFSQAWRSFSYVLRTRKEELIISAIIIFMILAISSTVMYYFENPVQPEKFGSVFDAMWWGVVTLSTVGYGDIYPISPGGKLVGAIVALSGISLFALPAGIIAAGLIECVHNKKNHESKGGGSCPDESNRK